MRLKTMFRRRLDRDLEEELAFHLAMREQKNRAAGASESESRASSRRSFGNVVRMKEACRELWTFHFWETFAQVFKHAVRQLRRSPGYSFTVLLTLALAIGANTAIFSLVNALLLKDLPYGHPDRIGTIYVRTTGSAASEHNLDGEQWELLRDDVPSVIAGISTGNTSGVNLQYGSQIQYLHMGRVSARYFDVLALPSLLGRSFSEDEDRPNGPKTVILSYGLWRTIFDRNPNVLGEAVLLKGEPYTVIGVLPENATTPLNADLYTALQASREGEGSGTNFRAVLRLRDGATWQQADAEMNRAFSQSQIVQDQTSDGDVQVVYYSVPLQKAQTETIGPQSLGLMVAAGFILLIACANLAGLTLVRLLRRTDEITTRLALGASQWQIQKLLWSECFPLALAGGAAGIAVGVAALRGLLMLLPAHFLPVAVHLDGRVLGFTFAVTLCTSILFGMLPALSARKVDLRSAIASRTVIATGRVRMRQLLIIGEVALTVVLLTAAGLLIRTLVHLETLPPGFNAQGIITAKASLDEVRYQDPAAFRKLLNESLASMRTIPGVKDAAVGLALPYERGPIDGLIKDPSNPERKIASYDLYVTPAYFTTLQIPVIEGRAFTESDGPATVPVVIINQTFARIFFHGLDPVGRYLTRKNKNLLIVGVVTDTVGSTAGTRWQDASPLSAVQTIYIPAAQIDDGRYLSMVHTWSQPSWIVRITRPVEGLTGQMQRGLATAAPSLPFSGFYSMNDLMTTTLAMQRIEVALLTAMAGLALVLSTVGIFALVANLVVQKRQEIGIRLALGSTIRKAIVHIGKPGLWATALGLLLGLAIAAATLRSMRSLLFGLDVYDVPTIVLVVLTLAIVASLAITLPALRVAAIDPAKTLREE
jgi:predicted permease